MKKQISAIKGTKDILPREAKKWQHVESVTKRVLERYAYKETDY
jgi:histidyl-tRNA synthetase